MMSYLTKNELANALEIPETQVRQWGRDRVLPPRLAVRLDGNRVDFSPIAIAFGELVKLLRARFGENSSIPVKAAQAALPVLERGWHEGGVDRIVVRVCGLDLTVNGIDELIEAAKTKAGSY